MLALGRLNARHLTLKRAAARGCSVPEAEIGEKCIWGTPAEHFCDQGMANISGRQANSRVGQWMKR
jgi:hypothetical protein